MVPWQFNFLWPSSINGPLLQIMHGHHFFFFDVWWYNALAQNHKGLLYSFGASHKPHPVTYTPMDTFSILGSAESYGPCKVAALHLNLTTWTCCKEYFYLWILFETNSILCHQKWIGKISPITKHKTFIFQEVYQVLRFLLHIVKIEMKPFVHCFSCDSHTTKHNDIPPDPPKIHCCVMNLYLIYLLEHQVLSWL